MIIAGHDGPPYKRALETLLPHMWPFYIDDVIWGHGGAEQQYRIPPILMSHHFL